MSEMCNTCYQRPVELLGGTAETLACQYLKGHPTERHSWFAVQCQDEADLAQRLAETTARKAASDGTPSDIAEVLALIAGGHWDIWLEKILQVGHDRKRARRGVKGFTNQAGER